MKIKIDSKIFAQALSEVTPFAPVKAPIAILKNAKITTKGNRLKIEANDTQCSIVKYIETIECDQDGAFLVNVAELNKFVGKIKSPVIEIGVNDNTVIIKHDKGTADFQTEDAAEFPAFKMNTDDAVDVTMPSAILANAINNAKGFVATEQIRPVMCTIYAEVENGVFEYCGSDTHKLIYGHNDLQGAPDTHWFIMPQAFSSIANACKTADEVHIHITPTHASYRIGNTIIQTVLTKGNYPAFKRILPQSWSKEVAVEKSDMIDALGRVAMFCDNTSCVKIDITPMDMTLSVDNLDAMKKSVENVMHGGCSGDLKIGVNVNHLTTSVGVFNQGEVLMCMESDSRPILLKQNDNDIQVVVMPMQLAS